MKSKATVLYTQFEKIKEHRVSISHVDSRQHIYMLPKILEITIRMAEKNCIRYIRCPKEKFRFESIYSFRKYTRLMQQITLNLFCLYSKRGINPYSVGDFHCFFMVGNGKNRSDENIIDSRRWEQRNHGSSGSKA